MNIANHKGSNIHLIISLSLLITTLLFINWMIISISSNPFNSLFNPLLVGHTGIIGTSCFFGISTLVEQIPNFFLLYSFFSYYELSFSINSFTLPRFTKRSSELCRPAITVHKKKSVLSQFSCRLQLSHGGLVLNETNSCSSSLIIIPFIFIF